MRLKVRNATSTSWSGAHTFRYRVAEPSGGLVGNSRQAPYWDRLLTQRARDGAGLRALRLGLWSARNRSDTTSTQTAMAMTGAEIPGRNEDGLANSRGKLVGGKVRPNAPRAPGLP